MLAILWRELKISFGNIFGLATQFVVPIFLLLLFATAFTSSMGKISVGNNSVDYILFFAPGIFGYVTFLIFAMSFSLIRIDRQTGMLSVITLSPASLKGYYWGKLIIQVLLTFLKVTTLIVLTIIITREFPYFTIQNLIIFISALICGVSIWFSLGLIGGILIHRDDLREVIMILITLPLTFASSMYYNIQKAPSAIKWIAAFNPLTYICNLLRGSFLGVMPEDYVFQLIVLAGYALLSVSIALISLKYVKP